MSPPNKVLFVTYSFPPDAEVGGKRTARFCRYLPEFAVSPAVLTVSERYYEAIDNSFPTPPGTTVIRTDALRNPLDWYRTLAKFRQKQNAGSSGRESTFDVGNRSALYETVRRNFLLACQTPDRFWGWYWHAVRAGVRYVRQEAVSVIISSGPPWTSHLVARGIKRRTGASWIADFRDPWTLNPWRKPLPDWLEQRDQKLERSVISEADRVLCLADVVAGDFRSKYPEISREKFAVIPNGIDGECQFPEPVPLATGLHLVHLGSLYGDRRLRPLLQAILELIRASRLNPAQLRISLAGSIDRSILEEADSEISALQQLGVIHLLGLLPFQEAQKLLSSANLLLLLQGDASDSVPAKFYEYLVVGKPILTLVKPGFLSRLIQENSIGVCADPEDSDQIARQILHCFEIPPRTPDDYDRIVRRFHFRTLTGQLSELIWQLRSPA